MYQVLLDSTVVSFKSEIGFCFGHYIKDLVKDIAAEVIFAEAYVLTHGFYQGNYRKILM